MSIVGQTKEVSKYDNLINSPYPAADVFGVIVEAGQGKLKRGTVLARKENGKMVILGTQTTTGAGDSAVTIKHKANCILADDIDATEADCEAAAYRIGHFNQNVLLVKDGYTLSNDDKEDLRVCGILLDTAE